MLPLHVTLMVQQWPPDKDTSLCFITALCPTNQTLQPSLPLYLVDPMGFALISTLGALLSSLAYAHHWTILAGVN